MNDRSLRTFRGHRPARGVNLSHRRRKRTHAGLRAKKKEKKENKSTRLESPSPRTVLDRVSSVHSFTSFLIKEKQKSFGNCVCISMLGLLAENGTKTGINENN